MALQLPRLPKPDASLLDQVADQIYDIVFVKRNAKGAGTEQAKSDAKHLAHATISRASAFITRDGPILTARNELLTTFGIDVATVEEVLDLLPESLNSNTVTLRGDGFELGQIDNLQLAAHLVDAGVQAHIVSEFTRNESSTEFTLSQAIRSDGRIVAIGSVRVPKCVEPTARMIVHVRQEHRDAELFADHFLSALIRIASENAPVLIELIHLPGQSVINRSAAARGFHRRANSQAFSKVAVGRPCSARTWSIVSRQMRRRTGLILPETLPAVAAGGDIEIGTVNGAVARIKAVTLENLLGPTLFVWPGRDGVIVPITRAYADELLGTASQRNLAFITNRDAAFLSVRGYVNAPRTAKQMRVGAPIIFYESKRKGGRGAAVAVARIINSIVVSKSQLDPKSDKRLVIDSVDNLSATDDVLLTTFDNLMAFPNPVTFNKLKKLDAVGRTNLVSAVSLSSEQIDSILTCGWSSGKIQ